MVSDHEQVYADSLSRNVWQHGNDSRKHRIPSADRRFWYEFAFACMLGVFVLGVIAGAWWLAHR